MVSVLFRFLAEYVTVFLWLAGDSVCGSGWFKHVYNEKGIYRPAMKCLMNSFAGVEEFCPVCKMSLEKTIRTLAR